MEDLTTAKIIIDGYFDCDLLYKQNALNASIIVLVDVFFEKLSSKQMSDAIMYACERYKTAKNDGE